MAKRSLSSLLGKHKVKQSPESSSTTADWVMSPFSNFTASFKDWAASPTCTAFSDALEWAAVNKSKLIKQEKVTTLTISVINSDHSPNLFWITMIDILHPSNWNTLKIPTILQLPWSWFCLSQGAKGMGFWDPSLALILIAFKSASNRQVMLCFPWWLATCTTQPLIMALTKSSINT